MTVGAAAAAEATGRPGEGGRLPAGEVRAMFNRIAPRYDLLNRLMTGGLDRTWRAAAADAADLGAGARALDLCTGTGDLALALAARVKPGGEVVGADFAEAMLERARAKAAARGAPARFELADALALPFPDDSFDAATVAFGARNLADLDAGLREMARVVRPGGRVVVLEITTPARLRPFYELWFDRLVPRLGALVARDRAAYSYLPASVRRFPDPAGLAARMAAAGLGEVRWRRFAGGIVALHHGRVGR
ncbi:MAG: demethylmenaquinone methyltransferase / 2-methoxy-6-polyprenyl,4-benzoquinol methylase [Miltoncostaeaceae bacterium]|nr:demethylmenaquinone methyltransferase / 2-methoxy-6-polyprenyl,4-benzoquinol methylase [Miltoncostaeaceae bacterium]